MSEASVKLHRALKQLSGKPDEVFLAVVKTVDKTSCTCDIEFDGLEIRGVKLKASDEDKKGFKVFPVIDSCVLVQKLGADEEYFITMYSEIDEILIENDNCKIQFTDKVLIENEDCIIEIKDGFLIKKGSETLKKIMDDLFDAIQQLTVNTNVGPSSVPINVAAFVAIKVRVDNFLK